MNKNILLINGNPNRDSFCSALADAYEAGAAKRNIRINRIDLIDLEFDLILRYGYSRRMDLEKDLIDVRQKIKEADHLVFVYPMWWGGMPALLKGFIERVFLPGFAFKSRENSPMWDKLLKGRSARLIITADTPSWFYRLMYRRAGVTIMKKQVLQFCGVNPVRVSYFAPIKNADGAFLNKCLDKVRRLGESFA